LRVADLNWMQLEEYLERDDRIVLPVGSTEQHAFLSLATDSILAERVSVEAAEPFGIAVLPVLAYGVTPRFAAYPGSLSFDPETYVATLLQLLGSLRSQGFRRVLIVNGHGGNSFAAERVAGDGVSWHDWWSSERQRELIDELGLPRGHASWMENFPWTRVSGVRYPDDAKPMVDADRLRLLDPKRARELLGDGNFGGRYQRSDSDMWALWQVAVAETREMIEGPWA
jgi:creatinine amidohydrolase